MSIADITARAQAKQGYSGSRQRSHYFREAEKAKKIANLKAAGYVVPPCEWLGHNNGPPWDVETLFLDYCWRKAHEEAWSVQPEIAVRRAKRAEELGLTYKQYTLEILERGRFPDEALAAQLRLN